MKGSREKMPPAADDEEEEVAVAVDVKVVENPPEAALPGGTVAALLSHLGNPLPSYRAPASVIPSVHTLESCCKVTFR